MATEAVQTYAPKIRITFKNGHVAELGKICLGDYFTLNKYFREIRYACKYNDSYESGHVWIDTKEIAFMILTDKHAPLKPVLPGKNKPITKV